ncbi:MAG: hypothetical protein H6935_16680 [Thiobacillus sp.]|nr:hypothetical protein [Thiobacillus sp.]
MKLIVLMLAALMVAPVLAAEPLGFKGHSIGTSSVAVTRDPRFDCRVVRAPTADQVCSLRPKEQETIAGARVASLYYFYDQARLTGITISLPESHFQAVAQALEAKYGPAQTSVEAVKNLKGDSFENRTLTWRQGEARLQFQRYAGRLDQSLLKLNDEAAAERIRQRRSRDPGQDL